MVELPWRESDRSESEEDPATPPAPRGAVEYIPRQEVDDDLDHFVDFVDGGFIRADGLDLGRWR